MIRFRPTNVFLVAVFVVALTSCSVVSCDLPVEGVWRLDRDNLYRELTRVGVAEVYEYVELLDPGEEPTEWRFQGRGKAIFRRDGQEIPTHFTCSEPTKVTLKSPSWPDFVEELEVNAYSDKRFCFGYSHQDWPIDCFVREI